MKLRKIVSIFISTVVFTSFSTSVAFASTTNINKTKAAKVGDIMTNKEVEMSNKFLKDHPDLIKAYKESPNNKTQTLFLDSKLSSNLAPQLKDYYTYFVADSKEGDNYTGEEISKNQKITQLDHNGTIYVWTVEIGYGSEYTTFNGQEVKKYDSITLDFNGDKIVDGFVDIWKIDNVTSGTFSSRSFSTNGSGMFETSINIL
ncbi:hypothetical protein CLOBY_03030 [Clostridium saccharobutylicum]|uniref:DUF4879 domain-containing protein n=1 Tax=Clostridium saccharobutylicum TaxID=169679 RepID=UPI000983A013|nr:DUF4879 domain-containing protein [Clostridium saccharobutylicum]AQS08233.1 hypothetical protein CLOBY_03030 [Clostridium saccharobutylicum]MBC2435879.1 DUF4879 domain-containing protein [Clostridium saccharobutylicum]NSB89055.1 hypothetical protein [Clostridium saccharobutylicum]NYC29445.1 hypothetical protein [Clostridium saccharobutylicum]OOM11546.1 hypothetical protein CLSAB_42400 [Clostridium saccharobutylicum]